MAKTTPDEPAPFPPVLKGDNGNLAPVQAAVLGWLVEHTRTAPNPSVAPVLAEMARDLGLSRQAVSRTMGRLRARLHRGGPRPRGPQATPPYGDERSRAYAAAGGGKRCLQLMFVPAQGDHDRFMRLSDASSVDCPQSHSSSLAGLRIAEVCALAWRDLAARDERGRIAGQRCARCADCCGLCKKTVAGRSSW
jgi:hypothetical protein